MQADRQTDRQVPPIVNTMARMRSAMMAPHMFHPKLCSMKTAPANRSAYQGYERHDKTLLSIYLLQWLTNMIYIREYTA